jgi:hypothetical protein
LGGLSDGSGAPALGPFSFHTRGIKIGHRNPDCDRGRQRSAAIQRVFQDAGRPYSLEAFIVVWTLQIAPQRRQANMCTTTRSAAIRVDLDQAISTLQASQIGAANCSIECLSISKKRVPSTATCYSSGQIRPLPKDARCRLNKRNPMPASAFGESCLLPPTGTDPQVRLQLSPMRLGPDSSTRHRT